MVYTLPMNTISHTPQDHAILSLLALTMFADKQVLATEIKAFSEAVIRMSETDILHPGYTETRAILWYENNKDDLKDHLDPQNFEDCIGELLTTLDGMQNKSELLKEMVAIANSDHDEHVSERALAVIAARRWGLEHWIRSEFKGCAA